MNRLSIVIYITRDDIAILDAQSTIVQLLGFSVLVAIYNYKDTITKVTKSNCERYSRQRDE